VAHAPCVPRLHSWRRFRRVEVIYVNLGSTSAMKALSFWKAVTLDKSNLLDEVFALLEEHGIRFCVIGGQAVNAYVEPLVSLDLDLVVAVDQVDEIRKVLKERFEVEVFPYSINISSAGSNLRMQIRTDPRYADFVERASMHEVLGLRLPVASIEDVLQGKIWAALHPDRRATKRKKDLLDIERLLEAYPALKSRVPEEILKRLT
jgi:Nucleotidyl transferase AbiEii toxin, Type IV TA system